MTNAQSFLDSSEVQLAIEIMRFTVAPFMAAVVYYLRNLHREQREIHVELKKQNGSIRHLLTWKDDHDKQDDERHQNTHEDLVRLYQRVDSLSHKL